MVELTGMGVGEGGACSGVGNNFCRNSGLQIHKWKRSKEERDNIKRAEKWKE